MLRAVPRNHFSFRRPRASNSSNLEPRTSNLEPRTSNLEPRTSNLEPRTSNLTHASTTFHGVTSTFPTALLLTATIEWISRAKSSRAHRAGPSPHRIQIPAEPLFDNPWHTQVWPPPCRRDPQPYPSRSSGNIRKNVQGPGLTRVESAKQWVYGGRGVPQETGFRNPYASARFPPAPARGPGCSQGGGCTAHPARSTPRATSARCSSPPECPRARSSGCHRPG
jgi:hypothetical protein